MKEVEKKLEETVESGTKAAKQSVEDWTAYIQEHPLQSLLFGAVVYFAVKGFLFK